MTATHRQFARTLTLTAAAPRDDRLGVRLLRVEGDGTAVIHVDETGETLGARPTGFFLGAYGGPNNVRTFREHGLQLESSDPATQTAVLVQRWCESHGPETGLGKGGVDEGPFRPQASDAPTEDTHETLQTSGFGFAITHWGREVVLTRDSPRDEDLGIRLLKVEPDGTAVIAVDRPGEQLSVRPGEYVRTSAGTFAAYGLQVTSTDAARQTAVLLRRGVTYYPTRGKR